MSCFTINPIVKLSLTPTPFSVTRLAAIPRHFSMIPPSVKASPKVVVFSFSREIVTDSAEIFGVDSIVNNG